MLAGSSGPFPSLRDLLRSRPASCDREELSIEPLNVQGHELPTIHGQVARVLAPKLIVLRERQPNITREVGVREAIPIEVVELMRATLHPECGPEFVCEGPELLLDERREV